MDLDCAALRIEGAVDAADGQIAGVGHLDLAGQLAATTASLEVGGDWNNHGSFQAGSGTVVFSDRCNQSQSTLQGNTTFATLVIESARGKTYQFPSGATQDVSSALRLSGVAGQRMSIRSTTPGSRANVALDNAGSQQIAWVDVADMAAPSSAAWLAPGLPTAFNAIDSGNNQRWFALASVAPVMVPATSIWALLGLAVLTLLPAWRRLPAR
ncbi:hypothetical protein OS187_08940 [Xanthomonadaceae bacterium JHOS43]|nr:hypothetical protein [Xanthomonadaceae bacterium JHOS43]